MLRVSEPLRVETFCIIDILTRPYNWLICKYRFGAVIDRRILEITIEEHLGNL